VRRFCPRPWCCLQWQDFVTHSWLWGPKTRITGALDPQRIAAGQGVGLVLLLLPALVFFATGVFVLRALPVLLRLAERAGRRAPLAVRLAFLTRRGPAPQRTTWQAAGCPMLHPGGGSCAGSLVPNDARCPRTRIGMTILRLCPKCGATLDPQAEGGRGPARNVGATARGSAEPRASPVSSSGSSAQWQCVRAAALRRDGHRCATCGATDKLEVHHRWAIAESGAPFRPKRPRHALPRRSAKSSRPVFVLLSSIDR
jgi:hypothetical protein